MEERSRKDQSDGDRFSHSSGRKHKLSSNCLYNSFASGKKSRNDGLADHDSHEESLPRLFKKKFVLVPRKGVSKKPKPGDLIDLNNQGFGERTIQYSVTNTREEIFTIIQR